MNAVVGIVCLIVSVSSVALAIWRVHAATWRRVTLRRLMFELFALMFATSFFFFLGVGFFAEGAPQGRGVAGLAILSLLPSGFVTGVICLRLLYSRWLLRLVGPWIVQTIGPLLPDSWKELLDLRGRDESGDENRREST